MTPSFWNGARVFVTGHTGFKGAWLLGLLRHLGARVTGYALDPPTQPSLFHAARLYQGIKDLRGDVRDPVLLETDMCRAEADIVIHLAAQALVRDSYKDPLGTYATNVMGTAHVLQAACRARPKVVIIVTTDKVYDQRGLSRPFSEDDPLGGHDPYSASKAAAELVTAAWRGACLALPIVVASARAGNVIGGGDFARDRILPDAVRAFSKRVPLDVRYPAAVRPWQHVLEPLMGYLTLAERAFQDASLAGAWNFGPGTSHEQDVATLVQQACVIWGDGATWRPDPAPTHPREALELRLNTSKAQAALGWQCHLDFHETITWTMAFYRDLARGHDAASLMERQIGDYLARLKVLSCASS